MSEMKCYWICITPYIKWRTKKPNIFYRLGLWILGMNLVYEEPPDDKPEAVIIINEYPQGLEIMK